MDQRLFKDSVYGFGITIVRPDSYLDKINTIFKEIFDQCGIIYNYQYFGLTNNIELRKTIESIGYSITLKDVDIVDPVYDNKWIHVENDKTEFSFDIHFDELDEKDVEYIVPLMHINIISDKHIISSLIYKIIGYGFYDSFDFILDDEEELIYLNTGFEEQQ